jgi:aarF domain-containing kinase
VVVADIFIYLEEANPTSITHPKVFFFCASLSWAFTAGQQLSIRPDLIPPAMLQELQKLCDSVRPVPDTIALELLRHELEVDTLDLVFDDLHLAASASLGNVYKAKLRATGEVVAIKVQRPGMLKSFSLDLFLLQRWGDFMDAFTSTFTQQAPFHKALFDNFSRGSYLVRTWIGTKAEKTPSYC